MISKVFCIYDSKVEAYLPPHMARTRGEVIRAITAALADDKHQFSKTPGDYTLFELGTWDDSNAMYNLHSSPVSVGVLIEFKKDPVHG